MIIVAGVLMLALLVAVIGSVGADGPIWNANGGGKPAMQRAVSPLPASVDAG
jgi:hypothetical protein